MQKYNSTFYSMIKDWCYLRDVKAPPEWSVPPNGFIVPHVACGFLICYDNNCGSLDFYMSNPVADKDLRCESLDKITSGLVAFAKAKDIKFLFCNTNIKAISDRANKLGFTMTGERTHFVKEL